MFDRFDTGKSGERMMRMDKERELLPFRDSQDVRPAAYCRRCGRELYAVDGDCGYCRRFFL